MKKNYIFIFLLSSFSLSTLNAQTITATGINPTLGESYVRVLTPYFNEGSSGTGQTWDISSITGTNSGANVVAASSTPNGANHPLANIAYDDGSNFSYFNTSASAFQFHGVEGGVSIIYTNAEDFLRYPFSYTDTYSDPWSATFTSGIDFYREGVTTVTADGTGTLITPNGTITNVLRIHSVQVYTDSADLGGTPYIINYTNDQYFWYKDGNHFPLASTYTLTSSASGPTTGGFYTDLNVGINENTLLYKSLKLAPNPASDFVQVSVDMGKNDKVVISIVNMIGEEVYYNECLSGNQSLNINTKNLNKGVYFVRVDVNGEFASKKLIVQ